MGLEAATLIHELNPLNPDGDVDPKSAGDDHLKMIKAVLKNNFPNVVGVVTVTHTELNYLSGVTSNVVGVGEKNVANGIAGLDANARILNAQMPLDIAITTALFSSQVPASLGAGGQGWQVGSTSGQNLIGALNSIQSRANGSVATLYLNHFGGVVHIGGLGDVSNPVLLYGAATHVVPGSFETFTIRNMNDGGPAQGAAFNNWMAWYESAGSRRAVAGFFGVPHFTLRNENRGQSLQLETTSVGGATEVVFRGTAGGSSYLYYNNGIAAATVGDGLFAYAPQDAGMTYLRLWNGAGSILRGYLGGGLAAGVFDLAATENSVPVRLVARNSGGGDVAGLTYHPDTGITTVGLNATALSVNSVPVSVNTHTHVGLASKFESSEIAINTQAVGSQAHSLGGTPELVIASLRCVSASLGYAVGDEMNVDFNTTDGSALTGIAVWANATEVGYQIGQNINNYAMVRRDSVPGQIIAGSAALGNFRLVIRAARLSA